ncbi:hypothetical protein OIY81_2654 [Cryptosporidium canis]|nr:hypothetical protein OIY81_2654 [Cryptosporidium canis]
MARLSLHPKRFESEYYVEEHQGRHGDENAPGVGNVGKCGRMAQKPAFPYRRRSISIGQDESDNLGARRLSRTSINLKEQIDSSKVLFSKSSSSKLPNEELDQLCNQCLNLLRQNKISSKNAFEILLIDHLNEIVNVQNSRRSLGGSEEGLGDVQAAGQRSVKDGSGGKRRALGVSQAEGAESPSALELAAAQDSNFQKFQRAAVTLEASARIYGYRVDSTFDNAYRILSNIKSGQAMARDDSDLDEESADGGEREEGDGETRTEAEADRRKRSRRNVLFSGAGSTLADGHECITIKDFDRTKDVNEGPFFVNYLNEEIKLDSIRFGVDCSNIGSISSMLMNNLDLRDQTNTEDGSVSISYNISGKASLSEKQDSLCSWPSRDEQLKVDKVALARLLGETGGGLAENMWGPVCPDLTRLVDSIEAISEKLVDAGQIQDCVSLRTCSVKLEFREAEEESGSPGLGLDSDSPGGSLETGEWEGEGILGLDAGARSFQTHVGRVIQDLGNGGQTEGAFDGVFGEGVEPGPRDFKLSRIGDVLDLLSSRATRSMEFLCGSRRRERPPQSQRQRPKAGSEQVSFEIPSAFLTSEVFDGMEWVGGLTRTRPVAGDSGRTRSRSRGRGSPVGGVFVGESNTSSIFNYSLGHLFCLANLTGIKMNLRLLHEGKDWEEVSGDGVVARELLIRTVSQPEEGGMASAGGQTDLMLVHGEIEHLMQQGSADTHSSGLDDFSLEDGGDGGPARGRLVLPFEEGVSETDVLLERSSKSLHVRAEYNSSLRHSKSSRSADIDLVKGVLRSSVQTLQSQDPSSLTLFNIIRQSRKLLQQKGLSEVSTGIFFICMLHLCNESNYSLGYLESAPGSPDGLQLSDQDSVAQDLNPHQVVLSLDPSESLQL